MSWTPISNTEPQYEENNVAASGFYIKFYAAGTTTPISMATDSTGGTLLAKAQLDTQGYPINGSSAIFIPHINQRYKLVLFRNATDADNNNIANAAWDVDNLDPVLTAGISNKNVGTVADMTADSSAAIGDFYSVEDYASGNNSGVLFFKAVTAGTGTADGGSYIDHDTLSVQFEQNFPTTVSIKMYGAAPSTDITAIFQTVVDSDHVNILIPGDEFTLSSTINFTKGNQRLYGEDNTQLWSLPFGGDGLETGTRLKIAHTGVAFKLTDTTASTVNTTSNIAFDRVNFIGNSNASRTTTCMHFDIGGDALFSRGFFFKNCSFKWFGTVWLVDRATAVTGGNTADNQLGDLQIIQCNSQFNDLILDTGALGSNSQINNFVYDNCDSGNNTGGMRVTFFTGSIQKNIMEGQADTINVISSRGFTVANNHFEGNTGEYCIKITGDSRNGYVGENTYGDSVTAKRYAWMDSSFDCICTDRYFPNFLYQCEQVNLRKYDNTGASERSFGALCNVASPEINAINGNVARQTSANHRRVSGASTTQTNTKLSNERVLLETHTTSGAGGYDKATKTFSASAGDYILVSFLMRRDNTSALEPYIQFKVNDSLTTTLGSWEGPLNNFTKTILEDDDTDEILITVFTKALVTVTDIDVIVYPYGVSPSAGLVTRFSAFEYHATTNMYEIMHSLNLEVLNTADAAPASGAWSVGDTIVNRNPSAAGPDRWRNVTAGSPGTWKALTLDA